MKPDVLDAVQLALSGDTEVARARLDELWTTLPADDFFHRCVIAHYMADLQSEPSAELRWDRVALDAALAAPPESFDGQIPEVTRDTFLPSLHLNLASSYERTLDCDSAARHAKLALDAAGALPATPLGIATREAILRLSARLGVPAP
jgi:hypothetical protein